MKRNTVKTTMSPQKNIALIAHDNKKKDLIAWCEKNKDVLEHHFLCGTGTTAKMVLYVRTTARLSC